MILTRGGVYLARLDPVKGAEVGKLRPLVMLTDDSLLGIEPAHVFVCPLSSRSDPAYAPLHLELSPRDGLRVTSYALVEHCRTVSISRLQTDRLAQLRAEEVDEIARRLLLMIGM